MPAIGRGVLHEAILFPLCYFLVIDVARAYIFVGIQDPCVSKSIVFPGHHTNISYYSWHFYIIIVFYYIYDGTCIELQIAFITRDLKIRFIILFQFGLRSNAHFIILDLYAQGNILTFFSWIQNTKVTMLCSTSRGLVFMRTFKFSWNGDD
ncbi:hypothetical protein ACJX0J_031044 [Zea mays]